MEERERIHTMYSMPDAARRQAHRVVALTSEQRQAVCDALGTQAPPHSLAALTRVLQRLGVPPVRDAALRGARTVDEVQRK